MGNVESRCLLLLKVKQMGELASIDESNFTIGGAEVSNVSLIFCFHGLIFFLVHLLIYLLMGIFMCSNCILSPFRLLTIVERVARKEDKLPSIHL